MKTKMKSRQSKRIKNLSAKGVSRREARAVKGGTEIHVGPVGPVGPGGRSGR